MKSKGITNMSHLVEYYSGYDEESRLVRSQAREIEYLTTLKFIEKTFPKCGKILDVAAGTGLYSFDLANKGFSVTAMDITPRYVDIMNQKLLDYKALDLSARIGNAIDLSDFSSGSFDCVLCMGPLYHLQSQEHRAMCIEECIRVLKPGGLLLLAYINKTYLAPCMLTVDKGISTTHLDVLLEKGIVTNYPDTHFLSVAYFSSPEEMEEIANTYKLNMLHHVGVDGPLAFIQESVDKLSDKDFKAWMDYHYKTCEIPSILGMSNHGLLIMQK